ncbi:MAG: C39 family peptidase [Bacteroidota bacterium]
MQNSSRDPSRFTRLRRIEQISENHCGPAVLEMLLENIGVEVTQEAITEAAGAKRTIAYHGTRVDQLAKAVHELAPGARLWYKEKATADDLVHVLDAREYPVGVEWQGFFEDTLEEEEEGADYGHYSVIAHIDTVKDELIVMDPYKDFVHQNRILKLSFFLQRWWDWNQVKDPKTGKKTYKKDEQLFFLVVPVEAGFPEELGMKNYY